MDVGGRAPVPEDAAAVVLNVTAIAPDAPSNLRVFPALGSADVPLVSNLNVIPRRDEPNLAVVSLGDSGGVSFYSQTAGLRLAVDVAGYFTP